MNVGKKILLIDDDDALRASLAEQLQLHEEFQTVEASNATEGINLAKSEHYDATLLDAVPYTNLPLPTKG